MEWKRLFMEHQTLWVDRCLLRDLWLWLCPPAMYSSIWKESSRSSYKLFIRVDVCFPLWKKKQKMFHHVFAIGLVLCNHQYHNLSVILSSCQPCFLLYYSISDWCPVLYMVWICVWGGVLRVSTGRCFIFVMKYIMHTYIQAEIVFFLLFLNVYI